MKWVVATVVAVFATAAAATAALAQCEGNYGAPIGDFRGVIANSNGNIDNCTWTGSGQWQCVDYVRRFYSSAAMNNKTLSSLGPPPYAVYAFADWANHSGMTPYQNNVSTTAPAPGDIYCLSGGTFGHVGIVKAVDLKAMTVEIIDQNRSPTNATLTRTLSRDGQGRFSLEPIPGAYSTQGWLRDLHYPDNKFTAARERNGGDGIVGTPDMSSHGGQVYDYGPYRRQDFSGGSFGNCCILYDPNNRSNNDLATDEAYLLRTAFYEHYNAGGGYDAFGCPSRDEYGTGDPGDAIQFFVKRVWNAEKQRYDTEQHYMYYDFSLPMSDRVSWHSTYVYTFASKDPSGTIDQRIAQMRTYELRATNNGTTTWYNHPSTYPYDYVTLKSCDASGAVVESFLNSSNDPALGWIDQQTPCTMVESSRAPGEVATFRFSGKIPDSPLGPVTIYFRVNHSLAGLMDDRSGLNFTVNVLDRLIPITGDFTADGKTDVGVYDPVNGQWFVAASTGTSFTASPTGWLANWGADETFKPLVGDFNADGKTDVGLYHPSSGGWFVATSNGSSFIPSAYAWLGNWGANPTAYKPLAGDFTGEGKTDVGLYEPATGSWYVATSNGSSSFTPSAYGWLGNWGANATAFRPIVGWFNSGGTCDVGLYEPANGGWYVATSNGSSSFTPSPYGWLGSWGANTAFQNLTADFSGDGIYDVCLYDAPSGGWFVATSNGSTFTPSPYAWLGPWGANATAFRPLAGDFNGDGKADVCLYEPANGQWFVATSNGSAFTASPSGWLGNWGKNNPARLRQPPQEGQPPPSALALSLGQNPARGSANLSFTLPQDGEVSLEVFDVSGRKLATLIHGWQPAGTHTASWSGTRRTAGIYLVRLVSQQGLLTKKLVLLD